MNCSTSCLIALVFIISKLYMCFTIDHSKLKRPFLKVLNKKQIIIYQQIISERLNIYLKGYCLGFLLSLIIISYNRFGLSSKLSRTPLLCTVASTTFITSILFYLIHPKSTYMLQHLNNQTQIDQWLKIYRTMQLRFYLGLAFGIIAVLFLANSTICNKIKSK